ncbi:MAG: hypothetical protein HXX08_16240 [Chloroflexi bacterium]|uniref:Tetratricopeptide repeat protein n=1 Tax=Candidatus Chlorohelix allophototropha TaxID=3003348 RepID=A0A8T7M5R8_9CHLR|nr:hypothetical protein [Chloroflexota bacterium]WJW69321.1 hypothetical protein OZ401_002929 [Chloroflexota bacterium L227-S17]
MAFDLSNLAKYFATSSNTDRNTNWQANDTPQTGQYSRDFLLGYLLHYCRLTNRIKRQGTIPILEALLEIEPENGEIYYLLARQYELIEKIPEALECFEQAAALRPDKPTYMLAAVRAACYLGERSKALALVGTVISAYNLPEAYYERGLIYEADENWDWALRNYEWCTRLDPENPHYHCAEARMNRFLKRYTMAKRAASKALRIDPEFAEAHEELRQIPFFDQFIDMFRNEKLEKEAIQAG